MDGTLSTNKKEATYKKIIFFQKDQKYQIEDYLNSKVIRSRLKTIFFLFDPFEQQVDHSNLDQGFAMVGQHLIISGMSAKIHQPRKRALDDPTAW